jgi:hypothetical protein
MCGFNCELPTAKTATSACHEAAAARTETTLHDAEHGCGHQHKITPALPSILTVRDLGATLAAVVPADSDHTFERYESWTRLTPSPPDSHHARTTPLRTNLRI